MKKLLFLLFLTLATMLGMGQTDSVSKSIYSNLDTMIYYNVGTASGPGNRCHYWDLKSKNIIYCVDGEKVTEEEYLKYYNVNKNIGDCRPCYLKTLDKKGTLLWAGVFYTDCNVGLWVEYYPNEKIKVSGQYKENDSGNWNSSDYCNIKHGEWIYYNEKGDRIKVEKYFNGKIHK